MERHATLTLSNSRSVELADLSLSLLALANEYGRFCAVQGDTPESRLYIVEIKSGSIVAELVAMASAVLPLFEQVNSVIAFVLELKKLKQALLSDQADGQDNPQTLRNLYEFVEPVVKDSASAWNIRAETVNVTINNLEAGAMQNRINRRLAALPATTTGLHRQVVIAFTQTKVSPDTGNRGVIESIYEGAVRTVFADGEIHKGMLLGNDNPLAGAYLVDVQVETVERRPVLYKIVAFHERL